MRIGPLGAARLLGVLAGGVLISAPLCGFISDDGEAWPSLLRNDLQSSDRSPSRSTGRSGGEFRRVYVTTNTDYESRSAVIEAKLTDLVRTSVITGESESDE